MKFEPIELYNHGARKLNIKHSQMRMLCSKLNSHIFSLHVIDSIGCQCGFNKQDNNHFLLYCPQMITAILNVTEEIDSQTLLKSHLVKM